MTPSRPHCRATTFAACSLSPVTSTQRSPSRWSRATARAALGRTLSASAMTPITFPSSQTSTTVRASSSHRWHRDRSAGGIVWAAGPSTLRSDLTETTWPSTIPWAPTPAIALKSSTSSSSTSPGADATMARPTGARRPVRWRRRAP